MRMEMILGMSVLMEMEGSIGMGMHVSVLMSSQRSPDTPDRVEEPKENQGPGGPGSSGRLEGLEP